MDALRYQNMKVYAQVIADEVRDFTNKWGESGELDMVDEFVRLTFVHVYQLFARRRVSPRHDR